MAQYGKVCTNSVMRTRQHSQRRTVYVSAISVTLNFEPVTSMSSVSRGLARDQQNTSIHSEDIKLRNGLTDRYTDINRLLYASGAYLAGGRIKTLHQVSD